MSKTAVAITAAIAFATGVLVAQTRAEWQQKDFLKALADNCAKRGSVYVGYRADVDKFGCMAQSPSWAMAPVFAHPMVGK